MSLKWDDLPEMELEYFEPVRDHEILNVALGLVEKAIYLDCVASWFVRHYQKKNPHLMKKPTTNDIRTAKRHLREVPEIQIMNIPGYAGTPDDKKKVKEIYLNKQLFDKSRRLRYDVRKFRAAFLLFVVILHELAHVKVRNHGMKISENAHKIKDLFGAKIDIVPVTFTKPLLAWTDGEVFSLNDNWIKRFVKKMIKDKIEDEDDFKIPQPRGVHKRRICSLPPLRRYGHETINGVRFRL